MGKRYAWTFIKTPWDGQPGFWAWWNRLMYLWEGPAQLDQSNGQEPPPRFATDCPICASPMTAHRIRRDGPDRRTLLSCPDPSAA